MQCGKEQKKALPTGIEPVTFRLTAERSTYWAKEAVISRNKSRSGIINLGIDSRKMGRFIHLVVHEQGILVY